MHYWSSVETILDQCDEDEMQRIPFEADMVHQ